MPSPALTLRTTARTRTCPCGALNTNCSIVPTCKGFFVRIKSPPSARFSTGETNFWLPFFHATSAFLCTFARGYRRLFCVSVMDNPYHYDIPIAVTTIPRVPTRHRPLGQARNFVPDVVPGFSPLLECGSPAAAFSRHAHHSRSPQVRRVRLLLWDHWISSQRSPLASSAVRRCTSIWSSIRLAFNAVQPSP